MQSKDNQVSCLFSLRWGLEPGVTVRYAGGPKVGRVETVKPDPENPSRLDVVFSVQSDLSVKIDSDVKIMSTSPLGDNHLELFPGLEFRNRTQLAEFFRKSRELYPDSSLQTDRVLVSGDHVITQWTLHTVLTEPFYGGLTRRLPISLDGTSIVRIENGKIKDWSDYYDGLKSRCTALAAHFEEWVEL